MGVVAVFGLVYLGMFLGRLPGLQIDRTGIALLGAIVLVATGGIGLLALDAQWLAVKEAAVPGVIGLAVLVSARTRSPLVKLMVYNPTVLDVPRVTIRPSSAIARSSNRPTRPT